MLRESPLMDCRRCTREIEVHAAFCAHCGAAQRESSLGRGWSGRWLTDRSPGFAAE
jgi:ribosomal protein L37E